MWCICFSTHLLSVVSVSGMRSVLCWVSFWSIVKFSYVGFVDDCNSKRQIYIILRISSCLSTSLLFLSDVAKDRWTATQTWHYFKMNLSTLPQVSNVCVRQKERERERMSLMSLFCVCDFGDGEKMVAMASLLSRTIDSGHCLAFICSFSFFLEFSTSIFHRRLPYVSADWTQPKDWKSNWKGWVMVTHRISKYMKYKQLRINSHQKTFPIVMFSHRCLFSNYFFFYLSVAFILIPLELLYDFVKKQHKNVWACALFHVQDIFFAIALYVFYIHSHLSISSSHFDASYIKLSRPQSVVWCGRQKARNVFRFKMLSNHRTRHITFYTSQSLPDTM